jgi:hypothetical protein
MDNTVRLGPNTARDGNGAGLTKTHSTHPNLPAATPTGEKLHPRPHPHPPGFRSPTSLSEVEVNSITRSWRIGAPREEWCWWVRWMAPRVTVWDMSGGYCLAGPKLWAWWEFRWAGLTETNKIWNFGYSRVTHGWKMKPAPAPANSWSGCWSDPLVKMAPTPTPIGSDIFTCG